MESAESQNILFGRISSCASNNDVESERLSQDLVRSMGQLFSFTGAEMTMYLRWSQSNLDVIFALKCMFSSTDCTYRLKHSVLSVPLLIRCFHYR
mmetsp:Transcript_14721/g.39434  ORF Transcript_14721/g.39434 Transcript_14721/m.39434 type:complete len:95 (-) Transcript_14721:415-699(-)